MSSLPNLVQTRSVISKEFEGITKEEGNAIVDAIQRHPVAGGVIVTGALTAMLTGIKDD